MAASLNLHRLFSMDKGYLAQLKVRETDAAKLRSAREVIRATLRDAFRDWETFVTRSELFEGVLSKGTDPVRLPSPKFKIQGSFAYHTVNDCQQNPPQEIDQDDGVFLPAGFVNKGSRHRPGIVAKAYFAIVEKSLKPVCAANGWVLNPPPRKDSCVRIQINRRLHIDLPLYSIKDESFEQLVEARAHSVSKDAVQLRGEEELDEQIYRDLPDTDIQLAHRVEGWIESDPRTLEKWFDTAIKVHGPQLRRLIRCLKGFRDAQWQGCDLSSICLMAAVVEAVGQIDSLDDARDDIALLEVARGLARIFGSPVENPAFPGDADKQLCKDWSPEFRAEVQSAFVKMASELQKAIFLTVHKGLALDHVRSVFGERVPDDLDLMTIVGVAAEVRRTPSAPQPRPVVPRTTSG